MASNTYFIFNGIVGSDGIYIAMWLYGIKNHGSRSHVTRTEMPWSVSDNNSFLQLPL